MEWLKAQWRQGGFSQGWPTAVVCLVLLVGGVILSKGYTALNHGPAVWVPQTPLDAAIPVIPVFIVPYVSLEPLIYLSILLLLLFRARLFQAFALAMILTWVISFGFYIFLQTYIDRPQLTGTDIFTQMIIQRYAEDAPYNDFPSLHVSLATILALFWWRVDRRIGIPVTVWMVLIILSTVFVKQHHLVDVIGGLILGGGTSLLFLRLIMDRPAADPAAKLARSPALFKRL